MNLKHSGLAGEDNESVWNFLRMFIVFVFHIFVFVFHIYVRVHELEAQRLGGGG